MASSLIGCAADGKLTDFRAGDGRLAVELPEVCDAFLQPVLPPAVTRRTDARTAVVGYDAALREANSRITNGRDCHRDERMFYKAKGKTK